MPVSGHRQPRLTPAKWLARCSAGPMLDSLREIGDAQYRLWDRLGNRYLLPERILG